MIYKITERDYYYRPTPEGADYTFDPVVWTREEVKTTEASLNDILDAMMAFNDVWKDVKMTASEYDITLTSGAQSENFEHPDHYYTPRHELCIKWD